MSSTPRDETDVRVTGSQDKAVDVMLAEFNALRAEIVGYHSAQAAVVGLGLTGLGVIMGLVVGENEDRELLMAIPPLVSLIVLVYVAATYRVAKIGDYIREHLWPNLSRRVGDIPCWESFLAEQRARPTALLKALAVDFPAMSLFLSASIVVLATTRDKSQAWWWLGVSTTLVAIALPIGVGGKIRKRSNG